MTVLKSYLFLLVLTIPLFSLHLCGNKLTNSNNVAAFEINVSFFSVNDCNFNSDQIPLQFDNTELDEDIDFASDTEEYTEDIFSIYIPNFFFRFYYSGICFKIIPPPPRLI